MDVRITIRDVPESVRDGLASHAAREGLSMQHYLRQALEALVSKPSPAEWVSAVRQRKRVAGTLVPGDVIVEAGDADRR